MVVVVIVEQDGRSECTSMVAVVIVLVVMNVDKGRSCDCPEIQQKKAKKIRGCLLWSRWLL